MRHRIAVSNWCCFSHSLQLILPSEIKLQKPFHALNAEGRHTDLHGELEGASAGLASCRKVWDGTLEVVLFGYESRSFSEGKVYSVCQQILQAWLLRNWQNTSNQQASLQLLSACLAEQSFSCTVSLPFYQRSCESSFWKDDDSEDDLIGQSLWIYSGGKTGLAA